MSENTHYTPENAAQTWRDLAEQLTPEQLARFEELEHTFRHNALLPKRWWSTAPRSNSEITDVLLTAARADASNNLGAAMIGDVAEPAGADVVYGWHDADTASAARYFEGAHRAIERRTDRNQDDDIEVYVAGLQRPDGVVEREIVVHQLHADYPITAGQARQLARALMAAADELDRMTEV